MRRYFWGIIFGQCFFFFFVFFYFHKILECSCGSLLAMKMELTNIEFLVSEIPNTLTFV